MSGKVSGHGMLAVSLRYQRELTDKNQTPMGRTEQKTKHARHHELLERAAVRDRPVVLLFGWWKERRVRKGETRMWSPGTKSLFRAQGAAPPSANGVKKEGKAPLIWLLRSPATVTIAGNTPWAWLGARLEAGGVGKGDHEVLMRSGAGGDAEGGVPGQGRRGNEIGNSGGGGEDGQTLVCCDVQKIQHQEPSCAPGRGLHSV